MLSVLVESVAVPIYWVQLEKIGASSQQERKAMFASAIALFDLEGMTPLTDREYIGKDWFKFLKSNNIHFVIRLRIGDYFDETNAAPGKDYERMLFKCGAKIKLVKNGFGWMVRLFGCSYCPTQKPMLKKRFLFF